MKRPNRELSSLKLILENSSMQEIETNLERPYKVFISKYGTLLFLGSHQCKIYEEETENLYFKIKPITDFYSKKTFENYLFTEFIPKLKLENRTANDKDLTTLIDYFKKKEIESFKVSREIYGVHFETERICLGDFVIYNTSLTEDIHKHFEKLSEINDLPKFLIEVKLEAKDVEKAIDDANQKFDQFENIVAFMVGDLSKKRNVKILSNIDTSTKEMFISTKSKIHRQLVTNYSLIIDLDDNYFTDRNKGHLEVWNLFSKQNETDLEKRIKNAVEWVGKGLKDVNESRIFIQFMFAIEAVLHIQPKSIINPSILSQISDNIAFLLYDDAENRKMASAAFKELYQKRSGIVHGSSQRITTNDMNKALHLCKKIIKELLTKKQLSTISTSEQLSEYLINEKFK